MTEPETLQQIDRTYVLSHGRKLSYFAGCDYFRLSSHPRVVAAVHAGLERFGLNVAASRITSGNHQLYEELEQAIAEYFDSETATVVPTGASSNLVAAQALAGNFSHALIDEQSHPSLGDAARFLDCPVLRFKHRNAEDVSRAVRRCGPGARLLLMTDGLFAREGTVAPIKEYLAVLPKDAIIMVDDAHGAGLLGKNGRGTPEFEGVNRRRIVQSITLSKAFGTFGGAVLGGASLRRRIFDRSRYFTASTPMPLPLAHATLESIRLLRTDPGFRSRLHANTELVRNGLKPRGWSFANRPGPIIALTELTPREFPGLKRSLLAAGIYPSLTRYPGGPDKGYFRFVISSEHSRPQLERLVDTLTNSSGSSAAARRTAA